MEQSKVKTEGRAKAPVFTVKADSTPFIFEKMSEGEIKKALATSEYTLTCYKTGEKIFDEDSFFHAIAFILDGEASVYKFSGDRRTLLSQLREGDSFGASSLFGASPRFPTSIYAKTDCTIMFIAQDKMSELITKFPQIAINYILFLSDKIRFLNDKIDSFAATSAEQKTAKFLLRNCKESRMSSPLNMTQISSSLGIGRASLYRILGKLEECGAIERNHAEIIIKDEKILKNILNQKEHNND